MIANTQQIDPMPVITGAMAYPENICEKLDAVCDLTAVDALQLAVQAGSQKMRQCCFDWRDGKVHRNPV